MIHISFEEADFSRKKYSKTMRESRGAKYGGEREICHFRSLKRPKRANRKKMSRKRSVFFFFFFHRLLDLFIFLKRSVHLQQ